MGWSSSQGRCIVHMHKSAVFRRMRSSRVGGPTPEWLGRQVVYTVYTERDFRNTVQCFSVFTPRAVLRQSCKHKQSQLQDKTGGDEPWVEEERSR